MKCLCVYQAQASVLRVVIVVFRACVGYANPTFLTQCNFWRSDCTNRLLSITDRWLPTSFDQNPLMLLIPKFNSLFIRQIRTIIVTGGSVMYYSSTATAPTLLQRVREWTRFCIDVVKRLKLQYEARLYGTTMTIKEVGGLAYFFYFYLLQQ